MMMMMMMMKPVEADQCIGDVFGSPHVEDEPGCSILNGLQTLDETGRQVDHCPLFCVIALKVLYFKANCVKLIESRPTLYATEM